LQFVDFYAVMSRGDKYPEAAFATAALMEIPNQFKLCKRLNML